MKIAVTTDTHFGFSHNTHKIHEKFLIKLATACKEENVEMLIHNGDWITKNQHELPRTWKMFREALGDLPILTVMGNHDCLDKETELLTQRGWIKYNEILKTDYIFSIDNKGYGQWTKINKIIIKQSEKMFNLKNLNLDMSITENHRVLHNKRLSDGTFSSFEYSTIKEMKKGRYRFPVAALGKNKDYPISDNQIKLLAWIFTDGSRGQGCQIWQSKIKTTKEIKIILDDLGYKYSFSTRNRDIKEICGKKLKKKPLPQHCFNIFSESLTFIKTWIDKDRKPIDMNLFRLFSNRQLNLFIKTLVSGDGSYASNGKKQSAAIDGTKEMLDWFQSLAVQCNVSAFISKYRPGNFRLAISFNRPFVQMEDIKEKIEEVDYNDIVWCLSVPYTNFMVRRNNKAYFTGNCWNKEMFNVHLSKRQWAKLPRLVNHMAIEAQWREWAEEYNIILLEDSPWEQGNIAVFGFNGWYVELPPLTNDKNFMPKFYQSAPIDM